MKQSRRMSLVETCANLSVGLALNTSAQCALFPLFGFQPTFTQNAALVLIFTALSLARTYLLRRIFEAIQARGARRLAQRFVPVAAPVQRADGRAARPRNSALAHGKSRREHGGASC